jgi:hypothetical protein
MATAKDRNKPLILDKKSPLTAGFFSAQSAGFALLKNRRYLI